MRFRDITVCDKGGRARNVFARGEDVHIRLRMHSDSPSQPIHVVVGVHRSADDFQCFAVGTHADGVPPLSGRSEYELTIELRNVPLNRGDYSIIAFVGDENALTVFDRRDLRQAFSMSGDRFEVGLISVDHRWAMEPERAAVAR